ncbi:FAD-dependent monooxygenase [Microlunatus soli]|uniref:2-polyprenyl-6-methoxyphenol hydroxylase n=1 Tax=Microlunatus soli TaxID=630515 RepID=A0A1H1PKR6_9ACTN|nr:FAD-dependent monooxygenase [Microlunatus soli]SDS11667.1 2-polyprenyl-6-methoxyphenol hydroxylase [Microlunatus soli]
MKILVSGASIAGPAVAYWLQRYGFEVTVVERAPRLRGGGYPIDIRGTALEVVRRMGIYPQLRAAHVNTRAISFVEPDGAPIASVRPEAFSGGDDESDLEVPRGDLARVLYDATRDGVEYRFNDSIEEMVEDADRVDVRFAGGATEPFDLVVAADGLHSTTRAQVFGPEEPFHRYLGYSFAGFTMPNLFGLSHEALLWNEPGRAAALYAVNDPDTVHAFLNLSLVEPPFHAFRDPAAQRELVASAFDGDGWWVPRIVQAMRTADDLFFDVISQIRMPRWASGRLVLLGDAAYAPSFLTGQGSSLALVGGYVLAGELATAGDHQTAVERYEKLVRPFVEQNQDLVSTGDAMMFPSTAQALIERNRIVRQLTTLPADRNAAHSALELPDYS